MESRWDDLGGWKVDLRDDLKADLMDSLRADLKADSMAAS
jgi:hypothetical protein